jgi:hypothetical protein
MKKRAKGKGVEVTEVTEVTKNQDGMELKTENCKP